MADMLSSPVVSGAALIAQWHAIHVSAFAEQE